MVFDKVRKALASQLECDENSITENTDIMGDLGADSLDIIELMMTLEEEFGIVITDESIHQYKTVGEVSKFIEGLL
jgi:acyl carrier protein